MPVYLAHGFRWPRAGFTGVRVHAIVNNLEDMAAEYIQTEQARSIILQSFRETYPSIMQQLEDSRSGRTLHFLEQYDPEDEFSDAAVSQAYAFVADRVITIAAGNGNLQAGTGNINTSAQAAKGGSTTVNKPTSSSSRSSSFIPYCNPAALSLNVDEAMSHGPAVSPQAWEALAELRDKLAEGEKIGWWIIYNGDPARPYEDEEEEEQDSNEDYDYDAAIEEAGTKTPTQVDPLKSEFLNQPLPTMLPPGFEGIVVEHAEDSSIGTAIHHPPPSKEISPGEVENQPANRRKNSKSFVNPLSLRKKSSKSGLQPRKDEEIPEPPKLKELSKKDGFRHKFFGRGK